MATAKPDRLGPTDIVGVGPVSWDRFVVVPRFPTGNERLRAIRAEESAGGIVPNALVALQRWRLRCRLVSVLGFDEHSARILEELGHEGIETDAILRREDCDGRVRTVLVDHRNGHRCLIEAPQPPPHVAADQIQESWFHGARVLLLDVCAGECAAELIRAARAKSMRVVLSIAEGAEKHSRDLWSQVDVVVADSTAACELTDQSDPSQAAYAIHLVADVPTIVTCGSRGSYFVQGRETIHQPAVDVPVVDQTGAGSVFQAGYIFGMLAAIDVHRMLKAAAWAAAMTCREVGCRKGIPTHLQMKQFLHES